MSVLKQPRKLRNGYTTGTCAAVASKAAAVLLLDGMELAHTDITLPGGETLTLKIEELRTEGGRAICGIKKDSGDDPDVTNGVIVYAAVTKTDVPGVEISGGVGIGRVTKRGLAVPVGHAAINPGPLAMIKKEVTQVMQEYGYNGGIKVVVSIPAGVELAAKTFNPRLGIEGGISVLGTTGILHPMSEQALVDTIRVEMNVLYENGRKVVALTPGNYGETFLTQKLRVDHISVVKCSNFLGDAMDFAGEIGFSGLLLCGHIGKFVKLAGGMTNLHSKYGDCRMELLAAFGAAEGANQLLAQQILDCVTTDEALDLLDEAGMLEKTMERMMERIWFHVKNRLDESIEAGVVVYSNVRGVLGMAGNAQGLIETDESRGGKLKGTLYGVGVGPGDPELVTLKAVKIMEQADVIVVPKTSDAEPLAYSIAKQAAPAIREKQLLELNMPMTRDETILEENHIAAAQSIMELLDTGKDVAFLTLGDPSIYSTYSYVHKKVLDMGAKTCMIPGVPSFCAAAAALNTGLVEGSQMLHVIPASYEGADSGLDLAGSKVLMKTGKAFSNVKSALRKRGLLASARMVQKCGLPGQVVYEDIERAGEEAGYFSIILVKDTKS